MLQKISISNQCFFFFFFKPLKKVSQLPQKHEEAEDIKLNNLTHPKLLNYSVLYHYVNLKLHKNKNKVLDASLILEQIDQYKCN